MFLGLFPCRQQSGLTLGPVIDLVKPEGEKTHHTHIPYTHIHTAHCDWLPTTFSYNVQRDSICIMLGSASAYCGLLARTRLEGFMIETG